MSQPQTPPLLSLPPEIRQMIWNFVIPANDVVDFCRTVTPTSTSINKSDKLRRLKNARTRYQEATEAYVKNHSTSLLYTCKQIHSEARPLYDPAPRLVQFCTCYCQWWFEGCLTKFQGHQNTTKFQAVIEDDWVRDPNQGNVHWWMYINRRLDFHPFVKKITLTGGQVGRGWAEMSPGQERTQNSGARDDVTASTARGQWCETFR